MPTDFSAQVESRQMALTREQVRTIDRLARERYRMISLLLMENAGRSAAEVMRRAYGDQATTLICCGTGNNGGDGCVLARHLHNVGWAVRVLMFGDPARRTDDTVTNCSILEAMRIELRPALNWAEARPVIERVTRDEVIVDSLLGTGFRGDVRSPTRELIDGINAAPRRAVVAIDVPSGLDCDSGEPSNATVRADLTVTFVGRKVGFERPAARPYLGKVEVAHIGAPRELIEQVAKGTV